MRAGLAALAFIAFACGAVAQTYPTLTGRVVDQAGVLSAATEQALTATLGRVEQARGVQIVVATIRDLEGYEISDYGVGLGRAWGVGAAARDDGALFIIAPNERRLRIEVGYGLEGALTDATAKTIIDRVVVPQFRAGDLEGGVIAGVDAMIAALDGVTPAPPPARQSRDDGPPPWLPIAAFGAIFILRLFASNRVSQHRRRSGFAGRHGYGGFGGGGFRGRGGGFGGGGGSFGGGGASGGW